MKDNMENDDLDEQVEYVFIHVLDIHHTLGIIPLACAFIGLLLLKTNEYESSTLFLILILIFVFFWIAETAYLKYLAVLPILKVNWKRTFRHGINEFEDLEAIKLERLSFREIFFSTFVTTNYIGWILMLIVLHLAFGYLL